MGRRGVCVCVRVCGGGGLLVVVLRHGKSELFSDRWEMEVS